MNVIDDVINIFKTNDLVNEIYFKFSRSKYLTNNFIKGTLNLTVSDINQYFNNLIKMEKYSSPISISYDMESYLEEYDPNTQFVIKIIYDNIISESYVINKKTEKQLLYVYNIFGEEHFLEVCFQCHTSSLMKVLIDMIYKECVSCNKIVEIDHVYECYKCCSQYVFLNNIC